MPKLSTVTITSFEATPDRPAHVSIGGTSPKVQSDGSVVEVRIEPLTVATDKIVAAGRKLLAPQLDAVKVQSNEAIAKFNATMDDCRSRAVEAHKTLQRDLGRIFQAASGQAVNRTLEGIASTSGVEASDIVVNATTTDADGNTVPLPVTLTWTQATNKQ